MGSTNLPTFARGRRVLSRERKATLIGCLLSVLCATAAAQEAKQELTLTAAEILARSASRNVRLSDDGKAIVPLPGLLIEDDGAAAGFSYKPNEELLSNETVAVKRLMIRYLRQPFEHKAWLLVGHTGNDLKVVINDEAVELPEPTKAGNYWKRYEIPSKLLRRGANEIALSGGGKLWIARRDDLDERVPRQQTEQRSYKRDPAGEKSLKLGPNNDIEGEYYVRLYLDGYHSQLEHHVLRLNIPTAINLRGEGIAPQKFKMYSLPFDVEGNSLSMSLFERRDDEYRNTELFQVDRRTALTREQTERSHDLELSFLQVLPGTPTKITGLTFIADVEVTASDVRTKITAQHNPPIPGDAEFAFEDLAHPRLAEFRKQHSLDDVIKGCTTDLQRMEKLAIWTSQLWTKGHLGKIYPQWDAHDILKKHDDGTPVGGFCQQFNIVFLQACESVGMPGRCVSIGAGDHGVKIRSGHEVVEIWSNEHNKWIYVDGQAAWYFVDKETRTPLNLLELRERQLAVLVDKVASANAPRPVDVVVLAPSPYEWKGLQEWPAFAELRMIPHTRFLDGKLPLPVNQGMRGWFWTGHRVWTDELYPGSVLYKNFVASPHAWNWPINQTHLELQHAAKAGELDVKCTHNMPSFAKFVTQIDDQPERVVDKVNFTWPLHDGENRLQVRAVNVHGVRGPTSWIKVSR
ncbi:transglutaminase domain-containing protein [Anatilimnocola floriformis]|uniref:transglutaminase domain-containing protein n=1 Tax=Anatilimnocola floriformis TaxID=2948575 RepID=UPI0020C3738A|nr:transglutaminase domain-containing protein [Anatilimnocola floriformis]